MTDATRGSNDRSNGWLTRWLLIAGFSTLSLVAGYALTLVVSSVLARVASIELALVNHTAVLATRGEWITRVDAANAMQDAMLRTVTDRILRMEQGHDAIMAELRRVRR